MDNSDGRPFAVVTGASSGIGYELAKQFVEHGFDLLISADDDRVAAIAKELAASGASVQSMQVDLANFDGVEKLFTKIKSCGRPVDAIAINAGLGASGSFAKDTELKAELNLIALNVTSSVHLAKRVVHDMVDRKRGYILFTSSIAGRMPASFEAVYGASQAFLLSFSEVLRSQLRDLGVTVTALMPARTENPADLARDGFEALMAGKDKVVATPFKSKMEPAAAPILPHPVKAKIHRQAAESGSARR